MNDIDAYILASIVLWPEHISQCGDFMPIDEDSRRLFIDICDWRIDHRKESMMISSGRAFLGECDPGDYYAMLHHHVELVTRLMTEYDPSPELIADYYQAWRDQ